MDQIICPNCGISTSVTGTELKCKTPECGYLFKVFDLANKQEARSFYKTQPSVLIKFFEQTDNLIYVAYGRKVAPFVKENILDLIEPKALQTIQVGLSQRLQRPMTIYVRFTGEPKVNSPDDFPVEIIRMNNKVYGRINPIEPKAFHCAFCRRIREVPEAENKCTEYDISVTEELLNSKMPPPFYRTCWAGLIDYAIPIIVNNEVSAVITLGQIVETDSEEFSAMVLKCAELEKALSIKPNDLIKNIREDEKFHEYKNNLPSLMVDFEYQFSIVKSIIENRYWADRRVRESEFLSELFSSFDVVNDEDTLWDVIKIVLLRVAEFSYIKYTAIYTNEENNFNAFSMRKCTDNLKIPNSDIVLDNNEIKKYFSRDDILIIKESGISRETNIELKVVKNLQIENYDCIYIFFFKIDSNKKGFVVLCDRYSAETNFSKSSISRHRLGFLEKVCHELKMEIINQTNIKELRQKIADLKELNVNLELAEKIREHETRAPLTSIVANAEFVLKYLYKEYAKSKERKLKEIVEDALICSFLLKQVKVPSKQELEKTIQNVLPAELIKEVVNFINRQILRISELKRENKPDTTDNEYSIVPSMSVRFMGTSSSTALNLHLFKRVLFNLCMNAVKYGKKNGTLTIALKDINQNININFIDDGRGIDDEDVNYIFNEGYRGIHIRNKYSGEGLGLSIAKKIVEAHGGIIQLEHKKNPTIFSISIPIIKIGENNIVDNPNIIRMDPYIPRRN